MLSRTRHREAIDELILQTLGIGGAGFAVVLVLIARGQLLDPPPGHVREARQWSSLGRKPREDRDASANQLARSRAVGVDGDVQVRTELEATGGARPPDAGGPAQPIQLR